jgi:arabinose-5-phosphate isomerase
MRSIDETPKISIQASLQEALLEMTAKRMGMVITLDASNKVAGIFTDGDLRRLLEKSTNLDGVTLKEATTSAPRTIPPELLAEEAIEMMEKYRINHLVVADNNGTLLGALNLHDLFAAKVI